MLDVFAHTAEFVKMVPGFRMVFTVNFPDLLLRSVISFDTR